MSTLLKISATTALVFSLFIFSSHTVLADDYGTDIAAEQAGFAGANEGAPTVAGQRAFPQIIGVVIKAALSFIGILFFGLMLYGGFMWMRAMGNSEHVTKAKDTLEAAIIGIVLILAAYAITSFVFDKLNTSTTGGGSTIGCENGAIKIDGKACSIKFTSCSCGGAQKGDPCVSTGKCESDCEYYVGDLDGKCEDLGDDPEENNKECSKQGYIWKDARGFCPNSKPDNPNYLGNRCCHKP